MRDLIANPLGIVSRTDPIKVVCISPLLCMLVSMVTRSFDERIPDAMRYVPVIVKGRYKSVGLLRSLFVITRGSFEFVSNGPSWRFRRVRSTCLLIV